MYTINSALVCCWRGSKKQTTDISRSSDSRECELYMSAKTLQINGENQSISESFLSEQTLPKITLEDVFDEDTDSPPPPQITLKDVFVGDTDSYQTTIGRSRHAELGCIFKLNGKKQSSSESFSNIEQILPSAPMVLITPSKGHYKQCVIKRRSDGTVVRGRDSGFEDMDITHITRDVNPRRPRPVAPPPPDLIDE
ncbi:uncharacterized protein LOC123554639 [Mercenaria mercenaria]|uniref:uncharacterized protein LOC123554639 n=1 Tax=Mercenaria mercenaria TaxID=6596 RepID=UPI00234EF61B|nr:uncharacterized protein LOC123554639 [Mercenaria mercenaria]